MNVRSLIDLCDELYEETGFRAGAARPVPKQRLQKLAAGLRELRLSNMALGERLIFERWVDDVEAAADDDISKPTTQWTIDHIRTKLLVIAHCESRGVPQSQQASGEDGIATQPSVDGKTKAERILNAIKDNRVAAVVLVSFFLIVGLATLTDSLQKLHGFVSYCFSPTDDVENTRGEADHERAVDLPPSIAAPKAPVPAEDCGPAEPSEGGEPLASPDGAMFYTLEVIRFHVADMPAVQNVMRGMTDRGYSPVFLCRRRAGREVAVCVGRYETATDPDGLKWRKEIRSIKESYKWCDFVRTGPE